jgi:Methyltransferase domain/C-methyltransferase C-terminal domain
MQNVVYETRVAAMAAQAAPFTLAVCTTCGFAFNQDFDSSLVLYDASYDNDVPSPTFLEYYRDLSRLLVDRLALSDCIVSDIGCGKGTFLEVLLREAPSLRGIGIDPSCTPRVDGRLELRCAPFSRDQFQGGMRLVILRHVLEHIANPVAFLRELRAAMPANTPLFVEVPDLRWTLKAGAFWDFCYEHCNYFTPQSLREALETAGFRVSEQATSFGEQYQWALCIPDNAAAPIASQGEALELEAYATREQGMLTRCKSLVAGARSVVWGMATKGVVFSTLIEGLMGGVDVNPKKQGRFAPITGMEIHAPNWLVEAKPETVLIMNPNYEREIHEELRRLGVETQVIAV